MNIEGLILMKSLSKIFLITIMKFSKSYKYLMGNLKVEIKKKWKYLKKDSFIKYNKGKLIIREAK